MRNKSLIIPKSYTTTAPRKRNILPERGNVYSTKNIGGKNVPNILIMYCAVALSLVSLAALPQQGRILSKLADSLHAFQGESPIGAPRPTTFLLGIFSMSGEGKAAQRDAIRKTYLDIGDERICKLEEFIRQAEETPNKRICQVPYTFVIGAGGKFRPDDHTDSATLTLDTDQYGDADIEGDCTYLNIRENMETGKSPTYMKFAAEISKEYGIDYISKIDDDSVLSPHLLFQFINDDLPIAPYNRRMYGGAPVPSYQHDSIYASGQFYFVSADLANYVANELTPDDRKNLMHSRPTEDCDMGSFVYSNPNPIKLITLSTGQIWEHPKKTPKDFVNAWEVEIEHTLPQNVYTLPFTFFCPIFLSGRGL